MLAMKVSKQVASVQSPLLHMLEEAVLASMFLEQLSGLVRQCWNLHLCLTPRIIISLMLIDTFNLNFHQVPTQKYYLERMGYLEKCFCCRN